MEREVQVGRPAQQRHGGDKGVEWGALQQRRPVDLPVMMGMFQKPTQYGSHQPHVYAEHFKCG